MAYGGFRAGGHRERAAGVPQAGSGREAAIRSMPMPARWSRLSLEQRAVELRPRRRDEPLRYLNITDIEVREIQFVAEKFIPKAIVNISPVVTGCPCEEGPQCTEQVYIVANARGQSPADCSSRGSRMRGSVGIIQQWWLRYDALRARRTSMDWRAYEASEAELLRELPQCVGELVPATSCLGD